MKKTSSSTSRTATRVCTEHRGRFCLWSAGEQGAPLPTGQTGGATYSTFSVSTTWMQKRRNNKNTETKLAIRDLFVKW